jgi:hypothetical protein
LILDRSTICGSSPSLVSTGTRIPGKTATPPKLPPTTSNTDKMRNTDRIPNTIADLESQEYPNVKATAEKHRVARKTLENRWKGKSVLMPEAMSMYRQCLTNAQEQALVRVINRLTDRNIPPTTTIVKNLAEEIRECAIDKN